MATEAVRDVAIWRDAPTRTGWWFYRHDNEVRVSAWRPLWVLWDEERECHVVQSEQTHVVLPMKGKWVPAMIDVPEQHRETMQSLGGKSRAMMLTHEQRREIARRAGKASQAKLTTAERIKRSEKRWHRKRSTR